MAAAVQSSQPTVSSGNGKRRHSANHLSLRLPAKKLTASNESINGSKTPASPISPSVLKPYLRKLSLRDASSNGGVDLSRPLAENQSIAGLAFYEDTYSPISPSFSPSTIRHNRSTSQGSNFSIPSAPYAQPFRHTPRPYTPPIARTNTANSSGNSEDEIEDHVEDERRRRRFENRANSTSQAYHSYSSTSLTKLANQSQSSLPTTRSRGDTMRSIDTISPSTRTSLDKAMKFISKSKDSKDSTLSNTPDIDPAAQRAATIQAARIAYAEKQYAKDMKLSAKAEKQAERERRRSTQIPSSASRSSVAVMNEKSGLIAKAYDDYTPAHQRSLPAHGTTATAAPAATTSSESRTEKPKGTGVGSKIRLSWVRFMAWLRTRILRMKKEDAIV